MILEKSYNAYRVKTGDETLDSSDEKSLLEISHEELVAAVNAENLTDQIFGRILKQRTKMHARLQAKLAGEE